MPLSNFSTKLDHDVISTISITPVSRKMYTNYKKL